MKRCDWCGSDELYIKYHDEEWGVPVFTDEKQFEFLVLESAQAGLNWITILRKRENYREAYDDFNAEKVASYGEEKVEELLNNPGIIRNRKKIEASINNAKQFLIIQKEFGSFCEFIWGFVGGKPIVNSYKEISEVPGKTELSEIISKDLKKRGFKFLGPTIVYAHMQAIGLINDHLESCFRHGEVNFKQHAYDIHKNHPIIDGHFDILMDVLKQRELGYTKVIETNHLPSFIEGGVNIIIASIYIEDTFLPEMALRRALDQISALYEEINESPDKIMLCKSYEDITKAIKDNKLGILLSFEGIEPIGNDLKLIRVFYELGIRGVGLVWSRRNYAADGCHFHKKEEGKKGGLTDFGIQVIREAEALGMFIDVSHLNDEGFWDVMEVSKRTIIASHSNCRSIANVMRNLDDDQIKAIANKSGIIGMNACSSFISDNENEQDTKHLINHVDHIVKLVGIEHVALGFDFCDFMRETQETSKVEGVNMSFDIIKGHRNIKQFTETLLAHGFLEDEIALILGGNLINFYKKLL